MPDANHVPYSAQAQQASLLCWAAATQIVVDVLHPAVDQATIATYAWVPPGTAQSAPAFQNKLKICSKSVSNLQQFCNRVHEPVLQELGHTFKQSSALVPPYLTQALITADIDAGRPIIFGWEFDQGGQNGVHYMVIVGYDGNQPGGSLNLHIYDPLPIMAGSAQIISFDNYNVTTPIELHVDMGLPYAVAESYYNVDAPVVPMPPTGLTVSGGSVPAPMSAPARLESPRVEFRQAIEASRSTAVAEVARRVSAGHSDLRAGFPLPIVALGLSELRSAPAPSLLALLRRDTGVLLYPILSGERVRDSFLLIRCADEWRAGGYANTAVTRRLVALRDQHAKDEAELAEHYLLSVPALGAFFLARGNGADARLIPVTDDRSIKVGARALQAHRPYRAEQLLPALAGAARAVYGPAHAERSPR